MSDDRFAAAMERVADATERHGAAMDRQGSWTRRLFVAVVVFVLASFGGSAYQQRQQSAALDSFDRMLFEAKATRTDVAGARADARTAAKEAASAREEIRQNQVRVEAPPASASAKPGVAILRVPRPPSSGVPQPAASVPIQIIGTTSTGTGP